MKFFLTILLFISLLSSCDLANINNENPEQKWIVNVTHTKAYDLYYKNIEEIIASEETKVNKSSNIMNNMDLFYSDIKDWEYEDYNLIISEYEELLLLTMQSWIYIDINSFVDWFLISEITKNVDSKAFSGMYVNVLPGKKIKMGPLWDFDRAFGNASYSESCFTDGWWVKDHHWYERLFQDPIFVELVKIRFDHFEKNRGMILEKIDEYSEYLKYAQKENDTKWMTIGNFVWPNPEVFDTYEEDVEHLKDWLSQRMEWLDVAMSDL